MISKPDKNKLRLKRRKRIRSKISGTAERPRLSIFRSNKNIYAQLIDDVNGVTLCSASSVQLKLANGGNIDAAKSVGADIAKKAIALHISKIVFDRSGYVYHGRIKALADAAREGGLEF